MKRKKATGDKPEWMIRTRFTYDGWVFLYADTPEEAVALHNKGEWDDADPSTLQDWEPLGDPEENK